MALAELRINAALTDLRARVTSVQAQLPAALNAAIIQTANNVVDALHDAAPVGKVIDASASESKFQSQGPHGFPGDAPGKLADSFVSTSTGQATAAITTTQPAKLNIVVKGRGEVRPVTKQALMWPGLTHPVKRAGPVAPDDFVSPVLATVPDQAWTEACAMVIVPLLENLVEGS